jgi:hypothetical protein
MKFKQYLKDNEFKYFSEYLLICERTTPLPEDAYKALKSVGEKLGLKVNKSDTIWDYLKKAGKGTNNIMRNAAIFLSTDIRNTKLKNQIIKDIKNDAKKLHIKEIAAFLMQLDKSTFGITSKIRHILQTILGVEVSAYYNWENDMDYLEKELKHIKRVLERMGNSEKELKALEKFQNVILNMEN